MQNSYQHSQHNASQSKPFSPRRPVQGVLGISRRRRHEDNIFLPSGMLSRQVLIDVDELDGPRHLGLVNVSVVISAVVARRRHIDGSHSCHNVSCEGIMRSKPALIDRRHPRQEVQLKATSVVLPPLCSSSVPRSCRSGPANVTLAPSAHDDKHLEKAAWQLYLITYQQCCPGITYRVSPAATSDGSLVLASRRS